MGKKASKLLTALLISMGLSCTAFADDIPMTNAEVAQNYKENIYTDREEADASLQVLMGRNSELVPDARFIDFLIAYGSNGPSAGIDKVSNFIEIYPDRPEGYFWRGYFYKQSGNRSQALENLEIAREINVEDLSTLTELTDLYYKGNQYTQCYNSAYFAVQEYEKGNVNISNNAIMDTILMGSESALKESDYTAADDMLQKAFTYGFTEDSGVSNEKKAKAFYLLSLSRRDQDMMKEAYAAATYAVNYAPENRTYINLRDSFPIYRYSLIPITILLDFGHWHHHRRFAPPSPPPHRWRHVWDRDHRKPIHDNHDKWGKDHKPPIQGNHNRWGKGPKPPIHDDKDRWGKDHKPPIQGNHDRWGKGPKLPIHDDKDRWGKDHKPPIQGNHDRWGKDHKPPIQGNHDRWGNGPKPPINRTTPKPVFKPNPTPTPRPNPTYKPTPSPTYRPNPAPRPAQSPTYRPNPAPRPALSPTYKPAPKPASSPTYKPAPKPANKQDQNTNNNPWNKRR